MDLNSVEQIKIAALGGADIVTVSDLTGTGVGEVFVQLGSPAGSGTGDGELDTVVVNGTAADRRDFALQPRARRSSSPDCRQRRM